MNARVHGTPLSVGPWWFLPTTSNPELTLSQRLRGHLHGIHNEKTPRLYSICSFQFHVVLHRCFILIEGTTAFLLLVYLWQTRDNCLLHGTLVHEEHWWKSHIGSASFLDIMLPMITGFERPVSTSSTLVKWHAYPKWRSSGNNQLQRFKNHISSSSRSSETENSVRKRRQECEFATGRTTDRTSCQLVRKKDMHIPVWTI